MGGDVVGEEGAAGATGGGGGGEHEVVDYELFAAFEEVCEGGGAVGAFKGVILIDFDMGKLAAQGGELVAGFGEGLLLLKEGFAGFYPFFACCFLCRMLVGKGRCETRMPYFEHFQWRLWTNM